MSNYHNIPHHIVGTTAFYSRVEVKAAIAFLHCLHNINQPVWFEKALSTPARGIGKTSIQKLIDFSIENNITIKEALESPNCPLQKRFIVIAIEFINLIESVNKQPISIEDKLIQILESIQFYNYLRKLENSNDRIANIKELQSKLKDIKDLATFLEDITLFQSSDEDNSTGKGVV